MSQAEPSPDAAGGALAESPVRRSLLKHQLLRYQEDQCRTKGAEISVWASMAVGGIVLGLVGTLGSHFRTFWIFSLMQVGGLILVVVGAARVLRAAALPTKELPCPSCGAVHVVLRKVTTYICPRCFELLRVSQDPEDLPTTVACSYCEHETLASVGHGSFPCGNCGVPLQPNGSPRMSETRPCPDCGLEIPSSALFCVGCEQVFDLPYLSWVKEDETDPPYDEDWLAGKDAFGHLTFARALLLHLANDLPGLPSVHHKASPLRVLERALLSLGEAAAEPDLKDQVVDLVPTLDAVYARVLRWEADVLDTYKHAEETEDKEFVRETVGVLYTELEPQKEAHIEARRALEEILGNAVEHGVGVWSDHLVDWKDEEVKSGTSIYMKSHVRVPKSTRRLREEEERFSSWMTQEGM